MSDLNNDNAVAFCGSIEIVGRVKTDSVKQNEDGTVVAKLYTKGPTNSNNVNVNLICNEDGAKQLLHCAEFAKANNEPIFRIQVFGGFEVDFCPSKLKDSPEKPLLLRVYATQAKPVSKNPDREPDQNSAFVFGTITQFQEVEFQHLTSPLEEGKSPARVKLTGKSKEEVEGWEGKSMVLMGSFGRQTNLEPSQIGDKTVPPYDTMSFSAAAVMAISSFAGKARTPSKAKKTTLMSPDYEDFSSDTVTSPADYQAQLDGMDDF